MSWNYRIIDHATHLALHAVHYDRRGRVKAWSAVPTSFVGDPEAGVAGLAGDLAPALNDALNRPVLKRADLPGG